MAKIDKKELTHELVKKIFDYRDGHLYWKVKPTNCSKEIGDIAGGVDKKAQRVRVTWKKQCIFAHRVIFLWHHGYLPEFVDHIDRNPMNNKIENLRAATPAENNKNRASRKGSTSEHLEVYFDKRKRKWKGQIRANGILTFLGYFKDENEAGLAYNKAAVKYHGEFANLNIIKPKKS